METSEVYKYRINNSSREVMITLDETDFRALTLWHGVTVRLNTDTSQRSCIGYEP